MATTTTTTTMSTLLLLAALCNLATAARVLHPGRNGTSVVINGTDPFRTSLFVQNDPFLGNEVQFIGGNTGKVEKLIMYREGKFLAKIGCWGAGNMIKAVRLWFSYENDDQAHTYGDIGVPGTGAYAEYTFQPGELVNRMSLWGNGAGERLGWIYFTTSTGGKFDFGMSKWKKKREYFVEPYGGMIAGAIVNYDVKQLYALGFYFHNEIDRSEVDVDRYDDLTPSYAQLTPETVDTRFAENQLNTSSTTIYTHEYTVTTRSEWSSSKNKLTTLGGKITVSADNAAIVQGLPLPGFEASASASFEFKWAFGNKDTREEKVENTTTRIFTEMVNTTANMTSRLQLVVLRGTIDGLPYSGNMKVFLKDGTSYAYPFRGVYSAAASSSAILNATLCHRDDKLCLGVD